MGAAPSTDSYTDAVFLQRGKGDRKQAPVGQPHGPFGPFGPRGLSGALAGNQLRCGARLPTNARPSKTVDPGPTERPVRGQLEGIGDRLLVADSGSSQFAVDLVVTKLLSQLGHF